MRFILSQVFTIKILKKPLLPTNICHFMIHLFLVENSPTQCIVGKKYMAATT